MLYPDPKLRTLLGWPMRWLATTFALLWVAAGALPVEVADEPTAPTSNAFVCQIESGPDASISTADRASDVVVLVAPNAGAECEVECEESERGDSVASLFATPLDLLRDSFHPIEARNPSALRLALLSQRANRAPPIA